MVSGGTLQEEWSWHPFLFNTSSSSSSTYVSSPNAYFGHIKKSQVLLLIWAELDDVYLLLQRRFVWPSTTEGEEACVWAEQREEKRWEWKEGSKTEEEKRWSAAGGGKVNAPAEENVLWAAALREDHAHTEMTCSLLNGLYHVVEGRGRLGCG